MTLNSCTRKFLPALLAFTLTMGTIGLSACNGGAGGINPNAKVATINGTVVTRADYDKVYNQLNKGYQIEDKPEGPQKEMLSQILKMQALNELIKSTLIKQQAKEMGIEISKEDVEQFKKQRFSGDEAKKQLDEYLNQQMISNAEFDEMIREELLMERFVAKLTNKPEGALVSEKDAEQFYKQNASMFKFPESIHASHILVGAMDEKLKSEIKAENPSLSEKEVGLELQNKKNALKKEAEQIMAEVKQKPAQFEEIAKKESDDPGSAKQGGDLGFIAEKNIVPEFWQAAKATPSGKLYPKVLETPFGFHIIKVEEHKQPFTMTLEQAKPMIQQRLAEMKMQEVLGQWLAKEQQTAKIDIEPEYQPVQPQAGPQTGGMPAQQSVPQNGAAQ